MPKSVLRAILGRTQFTLHATRRTSHGASRSVQAMSAWLVKTRRAPSRHGRDTRVYGHTTTAMHRVHPPPPNPPCDMSPLLWASRRVNAIPLTITSTTITLRFRLQAASANVRQRTTFHLTLARLIFTTSDDMVPMFEAFMEPLLNVLRQLGAAPTFRQVKEEREREGGERERERERESV